MVAVCGRTAWARPSIDKSPNKSVANTQERQGRRCMISCLSAGAIDRVPVFCRCRPCENAARPLVSRRCEPTRGQGRAKSLLFGLQEGYAWIKRNTTLTGGGAIPGEITEKKILCCWIHKSSKNCVKGKRRDGF